MVIRTLYIDGFPSNCKIYRIQADKKEIEVSAKNYEKLLPDSIDILLLGIGEDGHIASLFLYSPELNEQTRLCLPITGPKPPYRRVTVTPPVIKRSKLTYILAPSRTKSIIIEKVKQSIEDSNRIPVKLVKKPIWCCD